MCGGVNHDFRANELVVLFFCDEDAAMSEISPLLHLYFDEIDRFFNLFEDASFKNNILDDIHVLAYLSFRAVITYKPNVGSRKIKLWILSEQQNCSNRDLFLAILDSDELLVLPQILLARFHITNSIAILSYEIQIKVVNGRISNRLVFKVAHSLGVHKHKSVVEIQLFVLVANAHERLVSLVCMEQRTGFDMHQQHMVRLSFGIDARHHFRGDRHSWIAEVNRRPQDIIQLAQMIVNAFNPAGLVRNSNRDSSAVRIGEGANGVRKICGTDKDAFSFEYLLLVSRKNIIYCHDAPSFGGSGWLLRRRTRPFSPCRRRSDLYSCLPLWYCKLVIVIVDL